MSEMRRFYLDELRRVHVMLEDATREDVFRAVGSAMNSIENALIEFGSAEDRRYVELFRENDRLRDALAKKVATP